MLVKGFKMSAGNSKKMRDWAFARSDIWSENERPTLPGLAGHHWEEVMTL